ncbi:MAG: hypothetical protein HY318_13635 [Armatimonadetes bacterium]|nr:hypothetical protein [Armatimonadota bacterium]
MRTWDVRNGSNLVELLVVIATITILVAECCRAQGGNPLTMEALKPMLNIKWRLGPDYPMGIQDSAVGVVDGKLVSAGGFTRHPLEILKFHPDAFGGNPQGSGFTSLAFVLDPANEAAGWTRITDIPGHARQGGAVAVVGDAMYVMGGLSYDEPYTYRDTYQLHHRKGRWTWRQLTTCQLPWPVYGGGASTAVIGKKIYLLGVADFFQSPGTTGQDFHTEAGREGSPVGKALLMLDTGNLDAGWRRLADCPGVPQFDAAIAAARGKIYRLGGIYAPLNPGKESPYYNAVDSWRYDPATNRWFGLSDMPHGSNRRALTYRNRYIVLVAGFKYGKTWNPDGTQTDVYNEVEKTMEFKEFFENTVLAYDTVTGRLGTADQLLERTSYPSATIVGDTIYSLGGEGGPRLWHPATLQIGRITGVRSP